MGDLSPRAKGKLLNIAAPAAGRGRQRGRARRRRHGTWEEFSFLFNAHEALEADWLAGGCRVRESTGSSRVWELCACP